MRKICGFFIIRKKFLLVLVRWAREKKWAGKESVLNNREIMVTNETKSA